jgi:hypothetical protein
MLSGISRREDPVVKGLFWIGVGLVALGAIVMLAFVIPGVLTVPSPAELQDGQPASHVSTTIAVLVSGLSLASGLAAIGIGLGRWKRPQRSSDNLSPGRGSAEV